MANEDTIVNGGLVLDKKQRLIVVEGKEVKLTATEYKIVELLMSNTWTSISGGTDLRECVGRNC